MRDLADHADEAARTSIAIGYFDRAVIGDRGCDDLQNPPEPAPPLGPFTVFCVWQPDV